MSSPKKSLTKSVKDKVVNDNENGARKAVIEDLFYDFHKSKTQIYWMNFVRGIFFGLGSILGGSLVIALIIWILTLLGTVFPPLDAFIDATTSTIKPASSE